MAKLHVVIQLLSVVWMLFIPSSHASASAKAGLKFSVSRIGKDLAKFATTDTSPAIGAGAPVYLAAVLEFLCAEILELAGNIALDEESNKIAPHHITLAVKNNDDLNKLLGGVTIVTGGVGPNRLL